MNFFKLASATTALVLSTSANAALIERLGGLAYYDDVADLTWLADSNYARVTGDGGPSGAMNWADANAWAAGLSIGGVGGWRLPEADASCLSLYNCTNSDMGSLFYGALGNVAPTLSNTGPFSNIGFFAWEFWTATEYSPPNYPFDYVAWSFDMRLGSQNDSDKVNSAQAWAVQSGDVSAVPVPAAVWLFGSGLVGLIGVARRKKT
ncbi:MAG: hypothetical protein DIZ80_03135 [endosymbiont of Galathealinum brachiosum]|uniref:Lcl C-terminal domain-containing protein n=1 Tax=endosymbiont of Galathealinum brachiosum TaxID=2200906 RepID=A0A370DJJ1_9GAMM|nr:MAG: hypothetical protein DIZ80_03135 [endosymbiont of Galathealinum brachiosum]